MRQGGASKQEIDGALKSYRNGATDTVYRNITDDYGNQIRIPVGQQKPGAPAQAPAPSRGGPRLDASLGLQSQKTYSAQHSRDRSDGVQHGTDEHARIERGYTISGQRAVTNGTEQNSGQNSRRGRDAARSNVDERSTVDDASTRHEQGVGNKASRSESDSFTVHRDLMADPSLLEKVAQRNGMTAARFMGQEEGRIMGMVRGYAAEKGVATSASTMPTSTFAGESLPATKQDIKRQEEKGEAALPNDIDKKHKKKVAQTGYTGTAPVKTDTTMPAIATATEGEVRAELDPKAKGSIPDRAGALDENAAAWASADKKLGEGRANPMAAVEDMEGRDIKDTGLKIWDKLTGGDGTADGEKLTENQKRETGSGVQINPPGKK